MADLYFAAVKPETGIELYKVTPLGVTSLVADIVTGTGNSSPDNHIVYNNELYFSTDTRLWKVLADGVTVALVHDFAADLPTLGASLHPTNFMVSPDGALHFITDSQPGGNFTAHFFALWKIGTDGVLQREGFDSTGTPLTFFTNTVPNQFSPPEPMVAYNGKLYFAGGIGAVNGAPGNELWSLDAAGNAVQVADINLQTGGGNIDGSDPAGFTLFNGELYFAARQLSNNAFDTSPVGRELWKIGTDGQLHLVADISPGSFTTGVFNPNDSNPTGLTVFNNALYFSAASGGTINGFAQDIELWRTRADGVTERIADIVSGTGSSAPQNLKQFDGNLYFSADTPGFGRELWKLDGTTGAASQVADLFPGTISSSPAQLTVFNNALYFTAVDSPGHFGLFKVAAGGGAPTLVTSGTISNLTLYNDALYFNANGSLLKLGVNGVVSAGAVAGPLPTNPSDMIVFGATPLPTVSIDSISHAEGDSGTTAFTFTATLSAPSLIPITVNYTTADGTATSPSDYAAQTSGTITFAPGVTSVPITIFVSGDTTAEGNETFTVTLSAPSAGATIAAGAGTGTATILNDDAAAAPLYFMTTDPPGVTAEGGALSFTVNRTVAGTAETVTFALGGTATAGADYTDPILKTVTFAANDTTQKITLQTLTDTVIEGDESLEVVLVATSNGGNISPSAPVGRATIVDATPAPVYSIVTNAPTSVAEGQGLSFTVTRSATGTSEFVPYSLGGTAIAGDDYTVPDVPQVVQFAAGETTKTITVTTLADGVVEPTETLVVTLGTPSIGGTVSPAAGAATANILDGTPAITIANVSKAEGNSGTTDFVFTVKLSAASAATVSVGFQTSDGTAVAPGDYTSSTGLLTFDPGVTEQTVTVKVNGDTTAEGAETFKVELFQPINAVLATTSGTGTVLDDDANHAPVITSGGGGDTAIYVIDEDMLDCNLVVTKVRAVDVDPGDTVTYSIVAGTGVDKKGKPLFSIDKDTGALAFLKEPMDGRTYTVTVKATDSHGETDTQALSIKVVDDWLVGTKGVAETFVFKPGFCKEVVRSFDATSANHDILEIDRTLVGRFADEQAFIEALRGTNQKGPDTVIKLTEPDGHIDQITLKGVSLLTLDAADIHFV